MSPEHDTTPVGTWKAYAYITRGVPSAKVAREIGSPRPPVWRVLRGEREPGPDLRTRIDNSYAIGDREPHDKVPVYVLAAFHEDRLVGVLAGAEHRPAVLLSRDLADTVCELLREQAGLQAWPVPAWSQTVVRLATRGAEADGRKLTDVQPLYLDGGDVEDAGRRIGRFIAERMTSGALLAELEALALLADAADDLEGSGAA